MTNQEPYSYYVYVCEVSGIFRYPIDNNMNTLGSFSTGNLSLKSSTYSNSFVTLTGHFSKSHLRAPLPSQIWPILNKCFVP